MWLKGFATLLLCQCLGEIIKHSLGILIPGPVLGMFILFIYLIIRGELSESLQSASTPLIQNLALLFVPTTVGIFFLGANFEGQWLAFILASFVGTLLALVLVGLALKRIIPHEEDDHA